MLDRALPGLDGALDGAAHVAVDLPQGRHAGLEHRRIGAGSLARRDPAGDLVEAARVHRDPRLGEAQGGVTGDHVVPERVEPAGDGLDPAPLQVRVQALGDQLARPADVAAGDRVPDGLAGRAGLLVPGRRAAVQRRHEVRPGSRELVPQQLREEMVVAIPLALGVERHQQEAGPLEVLEPPRRARASGDPVAERSAQAIKDRRREQERAHVRRLGVEHLEAEIVDDGPVVARERRDERARVLAPRQRQRGELQARGPALGPVLEPGDVGRIESVRAGAAQQRRGLRVREAQLGRADLDQLAPHAQAPERQRGLRAGRDRELERAGLMVEQERHRLVDARVRDQVVVVEHEHHRARGGEVVHQRRQDHAGQARRAGEVRPRQRPGARQDRAERRDHALEEANEIVVGPARARRTAAAPAVPRAIRRAAWSSRSPAAPRRARAARRWPTRAWPRGAHGRPDASGRSGPAASSRRAPRPRARAARPWTAERRCHAPGQQAGVRSDPTGARRPRRAAIAPAGAPRP